MAAIHNLRRRIRSVRNTRQITRAMKLVAAARMKRAQERVFHARPYANKLREVIKSIGSRIELSDHPLLAVRPQERIKVVVVSADRGLCGSFNATIIRRVIELQKTKDEQEVRYDFVGRKAYDYFRNKLDSIDRNRNDVFKHFDPDVAQGIAAELMADFREGKVDGVFLLYNEFKSVLQQNLVLEQLLPLGSEEFSGEEPLVPHLFEPSAEEVLDEMLPLYVETQIYRVLIESNAAEQAARMTAMESATNNATEMIDHLTLEMNKIRQAAITTEIIEVVSGGQINE